MDLPFGLGNLRREDLFTFVAGLFAGMIWLLYLGYTEFISLSNSIETPLFIVSWFGATAILYVIHSIVVYLLYVIIKAMENLDDIDALKKKYKIKENSFYFSNLVDEVKIYGHVNGLILSIFILTYHPVFSFLSKEISMNFMIASLCIFGILTLFVSVSLLRSLHQYYLQYMLTIKGGIAIVDFQTYRQELAKKHSGSR